MSAEPTLTNPHGRGGPVAAAAREVRDAARERVAALAADGRGLDDLAKVQAARLILADRSRRSTREEKLAALRALGDLVGRPDTADDALVAAYELVAAVARDGRP